jgi:hypothetical protein
MYRAAKKAFTQSDSKSLKYGLDSDVPITPKISDVSLKGEISNVIPPGAMSRMNPKSI